LEYLMDVINLATGQCVSYSLSEKQALIAAVQQFDRKNWQTWNYPTPDQVVFIEGQHTIALGDWCVLKTERETAC